MNFSFFIARRYLIAKKSHNAINLITAISIVGVLFGTAGLIVVLSVFNGFGNLVLSLYGDFNPDIKITPATGKFSAHSGLDIEQIRNLPDVKAVSITLEENALLRYNDKQVIGIVKGVDSEYMKHSPLRNRIIDGDFIVRSADTNFAVLGSGVAYFLGVNPQNLFASINLFMPKAGPDHSLDLYESFNEMLVIPAGVFGLQPDFDDKYIIVDLAFSQELAGKPDMFSAVEITLNNEHNIEKTKAAIQKIAGDRFVVSTRDEQHEFLNKILKSEKLISYLILVLILLIGTFTIIGSLTMLILEKKKDIGILRSLGAERNLIRRIFLMEGFIITTLGVTGGLMLGLIICLVQMKFGVVKLYGADNFIIDAYPVKLMAIDFTITFLIVTAIGFSSSFYAVQKLIKV